MKPKTITAFIWSLCIFMGAFIVLPWHASWADEGPQAAGLGLARVTYQVGDALFRSDDTEDWAAVSPNLSLRNGDRLWAGDDSKVEVKFTGGGTGWLNYQSELDIVRLRRDKEGDIFQVAVPAGEASFAVKNFGTLKSVFQVDTPNASVRAYGSARFRVGTLSDGTTQIGVSKGSVEVETDEGVVSVNNGDMIEVYTDGKSRLMDLPAPDDWDDWVASRTERYEKPAVSSRYLPRELDDYSYELDNNGRWADYPDYGRVWVPSVSAGWSPYSNGRWVWIAGDYVWLPYDPWYAPFHYGRWHWTVSLGWCWVPPLPGVVYWSPGYVGWVWGADEVCWVPLGPGEIYYGYGYYGPHSVNIYKTKVVNITNVYINSRVNNGVIVVHKNDFLRGNIRRVSITERDNPFTHRGARGTRLIGRPPVQELKPIRETRLPRPEARLSKRALPPERLLEKPAPFIKQRGVARTESMSAFKPERRPQRIREVERVKGGPGRLREKVERVPGEKRERPAPELGRERERAAPEVREPARRERGERPGRELKRERGKAAPEAAPPGGPSPESVQPPRREREGGGGVNRRDMVEPRGLRERRAAPEGQPGPGPREKKLKKKKEKPEEAPEGERRPRGE